MIFQMIDNYLALLADLGAALPDGYHDVLAKAESVRSALAANPVPLAPCHCDPLCENFIDTGERMWLVDWEYAALGDPAFELAGICRAGQFDLSQQQTLVNSYQAAGGYCDLNRVIQMLVVVDLVSLLWCEKMLLLRSEAQYHALRQHLYLALGITEV